MVGQLLTSTASHVWWYFVELAAHAAVEKASFTPPLPGLVLSLQLSATKAMRKRKALASVGRQGYSKIPQPPLSLPKPFSVAWDSNGRVGVAVLLSVT